MLFRSKKGVSGFRIFQDECKTIQDHTMGYELFLTFTTKLQSGLQYTAPKTSRNTANPVVDTFGRDHNKTNIHKKINGVASLHLIGHDCRLPSFGGSWFQRSQAHQLGPGQA